MDESDSGSGSSTYLSDLDLADVDDEKEPKENSDEEKDKEEEDDDGDKEDEERIYADDNALAETENSKIFKKKFYKIVKTVRNIVGTDFVISGELKEAPLCLLDIQGYGKVYFPIYEDQASKLIPHMEQAPFGKGTQTVVDTTVRNSWQLDPNMFKVLNPNWERFINDELVLILTKGFELENSTKVGATLYKFLLYEVGCFFKAHRDTEKEPGMFGTLIIQLPSEYEGGKLVVRHDGKIKEMDFSSAGNNIGRAFFTFYSALYCDCEHELLPVEKGYRSCLVYNLTSGGSDFIPVAPVLSKHHEQLVELLKKWPLDDQSKLLFVLSHKYTQAELSFRTLKATDKKIVDFIRRASEDSVENPTTLALGLISKYQTGIAEGMDYGGYGCEFCSEKHSMIHTYRTEYSFTIVKTSCDDSSLMNGAKLKVSLRAEVLPPNCFKNLDEPDEEDYEGYQGNSAGTLEHWYKLSGLIIWPNSNFLKVAKTGTLSQEVVFSKFLKMVEATTAGPGGNTDSKAKIIKLGNDLLKCIKTDYYGAKVQDLTLFHKVMTTISDTNDLNLLQNFLTKFQHHWPVQMATFLGQQCEKYGWSIKLLPQLKGITSSATKLDAAEILQVVAGDLKKASPPKQFALSSLVKLLLEKELTWSSGSDWDSPKVTDNEGKMEEKLIPLCRKLDFRLIDFVQTKSFQHVLKHFGPACLAVVEDSSFGIDASDEYLLGLVEYIVSVLFSAVKELKESLFPCKCNDCTVLQEFLCSNRESQVFEMSYGRRRHLNRQMNSIHSMTGITHVNSKLGNPITFFL